VLEFLAEILFTPISCISTSKIFFRVRCKPVQVLPVALESSWYGTRYRRLFYCSTNNCYCSKGISTGHRYNGTNDQFSLGAVDGALFCRRRVPDSATRHLYSLRVKWCTFCNGNTLGVNLEVPSQYLSRKNVSCVCRVGTRHPKKNNRRRRKSYGGQWRQKNQNYNNNKRCNNNTISSIFQ
jgi:hypothetical protein